MLSHITDVAMVDWRRPLERKRRGKKKKEIGFSRAPG